MGKIVDQIINTVSIDLKEVVSDKGEKVTSLFLSGIITRGVLKNKYI